MDNTPETMLSELIAWHENYTN